MKNRLTFALERWLQRGALYQLLAVVAMIVSVALLGGLLAYVLTDAFDHPGTAIWWSFLRLTDPGYLGDDEGTSLRIISTIVTVLGYVLFMGSLIAILTQWLNQTMRKLESGLTPITATGHLLILGWTNRTPTIVREMLLSEGRVRRFLKLRGARTLRIVILADHVDASLRLELRELIGTAIKKGQIILRSGSSMRIEHLRRVDFANASAIILPGADFALGGAEATDARIIKTLMSIAKYGARGRRTALPPAVVAEIFDAQKIPIAQHAFSGDLNIIAGDAFISRLIAQNVRHSGLSYIYGELLSYAHGNEVYVRVCPELAGHRLHEIADRFPQAVLLGAVRSGEHGYQPHLNPPPTFTLQASDHLVFIARTFEATAPEDVAAPAPAVTSATRRIAMPLQQHRRILFMGWSHKAYALLHEFGSYGSEQFEIDLLSVISAEERRTVLDRLDLPPDRLHIRHFVGDYTVQSDLRAIEPGRYDNVVLLGSDWLDTGEESDARTVLGYVLLRSLLPADAPGPGVLVELIDPANARLFQERTGEVIISPVVLSHMLAHAALRPELTPVFEELFGPGGAEIFFRPASDYALVDQTLSFQEVQQAAARHGEIALGVRLQSMVGNLDNGVRLNPSRTTRWTLAPDDEVIVLATYH